MKHPTVDSIPRDQVGALPVLLLSTHNDVCPVALQVESTICHYSS